MTPLGASTRPAGCMKRGPLHLVILGVVPSIQIGELLLSSSPAWKELQVVVAMVVAVLVVVAMGVAEAAGSVKVVGTVEAAAMARVVMEAAVPEAAVKEAVAMAVVAMEVVQRAVEARGAVGTAREIRAEESWVAVASVGTVAGLETSEGTEVHQLVILVPG